MKSPLILAAVVALAAVTLAPAAGADETSAGLRQAAAEGLERSVDEHREAMARLDAAYREAVRVERNRHARELSGLLDEALQREDLETAMAISKHVERATESLDAVRVVAPSAAAPAAGFGVLEARWGMGTRWRDVTDRVRGYVRETGVDVLVNHRSLGDPAPRWKKTLFVAYEQDGELKVSVIAEDRRLRLP
jgi:hypothetical protein